MTSENPIQRSKLQSSASSRPSVTTAIAVVSRLLSPSGRNNRAIDTIDSAHCIVLYYPLRHLRPPLFPTTFKVGFRGN